MKHRSFDACQSILKTLFSKTSSDSITLEEAYQVWGRDLSKPEKNKVWISTLLTHLKHHTLVKPVYEMRKSRRVLIGIKLAIEGRKVLGRDEYVNEMENKQNGNGKINSQFDLMKFMADYKRNHPEYEIVFSVKLRETASGE